MALDPDLAAALEGIEKRIDGVMKRLNDQQARNVAGFRSLNERAAGAEASVKALTQAMHAGFEGVRDRLDGIDRRLCNVETIASRFSTDAMMRQR